MKYWLLTTEYPPFYGGGIGTYCLMTARMLADKGHEVTVFVSDSAVADIQESTTDSVRLVRFNPSRTRSTEFLGHVANLAYEYAHIVRHFIAIDGKPDYIEAQEYLGIAYYLLQYKFLLAEWCMDIPVVLTVHSPSFLYLEYNQVDLYSYPVFWICEMEKSCLRSANALIAPSRYILSEVGKRFSLDGKVQKVIPNPYTAESLGINNLPGSGSTDGEIIFFGKLSRQKGTFHLLAYMESMWNSGFTRPLVLIGSQEIVYHPDGLMMGDIISRKYKKFIRSGLLKIEGKIRPAMISSRLAQAAVLIVPSYHDNLPYVVLEMMALGRILLVSKQGGQSEVITDGIDGFVFDHKEMNSFQEKLLQILELPISTREQISLGARRRAAEFSGEIIYAEKIAFLESVSSRESVSEFPFIRERSDSPQATPAIVESVKNKLSVVIPYFNLGRYVREAVNSVLASGVTDVEVIIVNDGSNELESIAELDSLKDLARVKIVDRINHGLGDTRNAGAQIADGEFLAFLDADDTVEAGYYPWALKVLTHYSNVHFTGSWVQYTDGSTARWPSFNPEPPLLLYHNIVNSSALVYKRSSYLQAGSNETRMPFQGLEDYESVISLVANGMGGVVLPETLFNYRVRPDSMIRDISRIKKLNLMDWITRKHSKIYGIFARDVIGLLNANGPGIFLDNPTLDKPLVTRLPFGLKLSPKIVSAIKKNVILKRIAYRIYKRIKK